MTIIKIQEEFHFTDFQYGMVNTSFLISYAIMFTVGGRLMDTLGSRIGLLLSIGVWSLACGLHGFVTNVYQLMAFRFLLGAGEGGCFPGAAKVVYEWFDEKRRAMAMGIAIGGSAIGAVIAPPLTISISNNLGWRWAFFIPALIGFIWIIGWVLIPWSKNRLNTGSANSKVKESAIPFGVILKNKEARVFILMRFMLDPVVYFIMFWVPKYLHDQRHIPFEQIGNLFWIPFMALGVSNIIGGMFSDQLVKNKFSVNKARKVVMGVAAVMTMVAPFTAFVSSVTMAVTLMSLVMFAHGFWITNYITAISDVFGAHGTSTVVGLSGTAGAISGLAINPLIGLVVQNYSYTPIWIISGIMYPLAFVLFLILVPKLLPLSFKKPVPDFINETLPNG